MSHLITTILSNTLQLTPTEIKTTESCFHDWKLFLDTLQHQQSDDRIDNSDLFYQIINYPNSPIDPMMFTDDSALRKWAEIVNLAKSHYRVINKQSQYYIIENLTPIGWYYVPLKYSDYWLIASYFKINRTLYQFFYRKKLKILRKVIDQLIIKMFTHSVQVDVVRKMFHFTIRLNKENFQVSLDPTKIIIYSLSTKLIVFEFSDLLRTPYYRVLNSLYWQHLALKRCFTLFKDPSESSTPTILD